MTGTGDRTCLGCHARFTPRPEYAKYPPEFRRFCRPRCLFMQCEQRARQLTTDFGRGASAAAAESGRPYEYIRMTDERLFRHPAPPAVAAARRERLRELAEAT